MNTRNSISSVLRGGLHALVLAAAASGPLAWAGPTLVPFKATLDTKEVLGFDPVRCPGTSIVGTITGLGNASHLGKVRLESTDCPALADSPPSFSGGRLTLTAANGDRITAVYQGVLLPVSLPDQMFSISGQYTVTGGTGRFANATGSGVIHGGITLGAETSTGRYEISGALSY